jgi:hypothetical protein
MEMGPDTTQELWRTEFDKQFTREMLRELVKRTMALVKRYERFTPRRSTDTADDRINSALVRLLHGARIWNPSRVDLGGFLLGVVASDLTGELRRAKLAPTSSLDEKPGHREDDYTGEPCDESGTDSHASPNEGWPAPFVTRSMEEAWSLALKDLRVRAGEDAGVLGLLGAYEEGVFQKREVLALLKWSPRKYKQNYQRLVDLASAADDSVRESLTDVFAN